MHIQMHLPTKIHAYTLHIHTHKHTHTHIQGSNRLSLYWFLNIKYPIDAVNCSPSNFCIF